MFDKDASEVKKAFENLQKDEVRIIVENFDNASYVLDKALEGSDFIFNKERILNCSKEEQAAILNEIIQAKNLSAEQKKAIVNYVKRGNDYNAVKWVFETRMEEATEKAVSVINENVNPDMSGIVKANVSGTERQIVRGNIVKNEDGTINKELSDKQLYYIDENGNTQVASIDNVELTEFIPQTDAIDKAIEITTKPIILQQANNENVFVGESVEFNRDGQSGKIEVNNLNEDGTYNIDITDKDGNTVNANVSEEQIRQFFEQTSENNPDIQADESANGETISELQSASALERIPKNEKGELLFEQSDPEITLSALGEIYDSRDELQSVIEATVSNLQKRIEKLRSPKSSGDIQKDIVNKQKAKAEIAEIQGRLDYWNSLLASMKPTKESVTKQLTGENGDLNTGVNDETTTDTAGREENKGGYPVLNSRQAEALLSMMEENAADAPVLELTAENWYSEFGEDGIVSTPVGDVKMGENQYLKLQVKGREGQFGMIKTTLTNPDVVIEKYSTKEGAERDTKLLFVKTFTDAAGKKHIFFESVTVKQDGLEVSISSHIADKKAIAKELVNGTIAYNKFADRSELYLPENLESLPDLVPTQANVSEGKGSENNSNENKKSEENGNERTSKRSDGSERHSDSGSNKHRVTESDKNDLSVADGNEISGRTVRETDKGRDFDGAGRVAGERTIDAGNDDGSGNENDVRHGRSIDDAAVQAGQPEPADKADGGKAAVRKEETPNPTQEPVREKMTGPKVANTMAANDEFLTSSDYIEKRIQQYVDENGLNLYDFEGSPEWKNLYNQYEKEYTAYLKAFIDSYDNASETEKSVLDENLNDAGVSIDEIRAYDGEKVRFHSPHRKLSPISQKLFQKFIDWLKATGLAKDFVIDEKAMREVLGRKGVEVFYQIAELSAVNARFNEELESLTLENADSKVFSLGMPSQILQATGISNKLLKLYGNKLRAKAEKHGFKFTDIKNLPSAVQNPIAVFKGSVDGSYAILTELNIDGKKVLVSLTTGKGNDVDFNIISSVYGKSDSGILSWINDGKLLYVDKEKTLNYLRISAPIAEAQDNSGLNSLAKVIEEFENPKIEGENLSLPDGIKLMATSKGEVYGFVTKDGTIYIDPNLMNANTPMHELGHLWVDFIEVNNPDLWNKGVELIKNSPYWKLVNDHPLYAGDSEKKRIKEALSMAIGDKDEAMMQEALKGGDLSGFAKIRKWLNDVWNFIKQHLGIRSLSAEQIERLTLNDFLNGAVADLLSGEKITAKKTGAARAKETEAEQVKLAIAAAEKATDTNPTEAQKKAGNYKMGHVNVQGFDITIENPKGSVRRGVDENGKAWETKMNNTYGYFGKTESRDGDHIDLFLGNNPLSNHIFVIDQINPETGTFDEHKVMFGFDDIEEARKAYLFNYEKGWKGLGNITGVDVEDFRAWAVKDGRRIKAFAEYKRDFPVNIPNETASAARAKEVESFLNETAEGQEITRQIAETRAKYTVPRRAKGIDEAIELFKREGKGVVENTKLGLRAGITGKSLNKFRNLKESEDARLHALAVANIDLLFENAEFDVNHTDKKERPEIEKVHRLGNLMFDEKTNNYVPVMITMFEYNDGHGNKVYSVEAVDIETEKNSAGQMSDGKSPHDPIAEFSTKVQQLYESAIANEENAKFQINFAENKSVKNRDRQPDFADYKGDIIAFANAMNEWNGKNNLEGTSKSANLDSGVRYQTVLNNQDVDSHPPQINSGESILDYAKRMNEFWAEQAKDMDVISRELAKTKNELNRLRTRRNKLADKRLEKTEAIRENIGDVRKYIKENLEGEMLKWMGEREFNSLIGSMENATKRKELEPVYKAIDRTINNIETRRNKRILETLLKTKVLDKNKKGVSVAKNVDGDARQSMEYINKNKDLSKDEIKNRMDDIQERIDNGESLPDDERMLSDLAVIDLLSDVNIAKNNIEFIDDEISNLNKEALHDLGLDKKGRTLAKETLRDDRLVAQNELNAAYEKAIVELNELISTGKSNLIEWKKNETAHKRKIGKMVIEAVRKRLVLGQGAEKEIGKWEWFRRAMNDNPAMNLLLSPLDSFNFMVKYHYCPIKIQFYFHIISIQLITIAFFYF